MPLKVGLRALVFSALLTTLSGFFLLSRRWFADEELTTVVLLIALFSFAPAYLYFGKVEKLEKQAREGSRKLTLRCVGIYRVCRQFLLSYEKQPEKIVALTKIVGSEGLPEEVAKYLNSWGFTEMPSVENILQQGMIYRSLIENTRGLPPPPFREYTFLFHRRLATIRIRRWEDILYWQEDWADEGAEELNEEAEKEAKKKVLETLWKVALVASQPVFDDARAYLREYEKQDTSSNPDEEKARTKKMMELIARAEELRNNLFRLIHTVPELAQAYGKECETLWNLIPQMQTKFKGIRESRINKLTNRREERTSVK